MKNYRTTLVLSVLLLTLGLMYYFFRSKGSDMEGTAAAFAVKDTASVAEIRLIAYRNNKAYLQTQLSRQANKWTVNNKYPAQSERIQSLLSTIYSLQVSEAAHPNARENVIKKLTLDHIRVEIEMKDGSEKVYFVGEQPAIGNGSMMLMKGSDEPYYVELPGVVGYLKPYYSAYMNDWRDNTLFELNEKNFKRLAVTYPGADSSYSIERKGNQYVLASGEGLDSILFRKFLKGTGKKGSAGFADRELPRGLDSLSKIRPDITLTVETTDHPKPTEIVLYRRIETGDSYLGWVKGKNELLVIQHFTLQNILVRRKEWLSLQKGS